MFSNYFRASSQTKLENPERVLSQNQKVVKFWQLEFYRAFSMYAARILRTNMKKLKLPFLRSTGGGCFWSWFSCDLLTTDHVVIDVLDRSQRREVWRGDKSLMLASILLLMFLNGPELFFTTWWTQPKLEFSLLWRSTFASRAVITCHKIISAISLHETEELWASFPDSGNSVHGKHVICHEEMS